jgi:hypothetical protein
MRLFKERGLFNSTWYNHSSPILKDDIEALQPPRTANLNALITFLFRHLRAMTSVPPDDIAPAPATADELPVPIVGHPREQLSIEEPVLTTTEEPAVQYPSGAKLYMTLASLSLSLFLQGLVSPTPPPHRPVLHSDIDLPCRTSR